MDKDFEKKVKQKKIRTVAVAVVVIAAVVYLISGTKVEKADYTESLNKEIQTAQELYEVNKNLVGNDAGQYAEYTVLKFAQDIAKAEAVAADESSEYHDKKNAYEALKSQIDAFKNGMNDPVLSQEDVQALIDGKEKKEVKTAIKDGKEIVYTVAGENLDKAVTVNLTAREEGPYYDQINEILGKKKLQGQVISFYQDGTFGGKIQVQTPIYSEKETQGYAYKINLEKGKMSFVSEAKIDVEAQTAVFTVDEGGDYVVLTRKIHKDKKPVKAEVETPSSSVEDEETFADEDMDTEETTGDSTDVDIDEEEADDETGDDSTAAPPEVSATIKINIDIRCDTLAADLSKLRDPALEAYVPADGCILSLTDVEVKKGATVYDVLDMVCRNKGIHLEAVYTPNYGADYIEGINYLYEFDAGEQSGWMYMVNGTFPNYGCSDYMLEDGDSVVWAYTCDMGKDLGKSF